MFGEDTEVRAEQKEADLIKTVSDFFDDPDIGDFIDASMEVWEGHYKNAAEFFEIISEEDMTPRYQVLMFDPETEEIVPEVRAVSNYAKRRKAFKRTAACGFSVFAHFETICAFKCLDPEGEVYEVRKITDTVETAIIRGGRIVIRTHGSCGAAEREEHE